DGILDRRRQVERLGDGLVHLPVADAQGLSGLHEALRLSLVPAGRLRRAAMPGSSWPSTNSSDAPPPVETCEILSATPASLTAATESPPPTTVVPRLSARALATPRVPAAKRGFSNIPIGPFQNTVWAVPMRAA